ncbi:MAG: GNAT family N-acetyltransferase [Casimicrobiaceae bacterium]
MSGVCTHPDVRGYSMARQLMTRLIRVQLRRGQVPFLHVMSANQAARALYEKMGFRHHQQIAVRVISRQPLPAEKHEARH